MQQPEARPDHFWNKLRPNRIPPRRPWRTAGGGGGHDQLAHEAVDPKRVCQGQKAKGASCATSSPPKASPCVPT